MANGDGVASLLDVRDFFGMELAAFKRDWLQLSDDDKRALREGIGNGTLTY